MNSRILSEARENSGDRGPPSPFYLGERIQPATMPPEFLDWLLLRPSLLVAVTSFFMFLLMLALVRWGSWTDERERRAVLFISLVFALLAMVVTVASVLRI